MGDAQSGSQREPLWCQKVPVNSSFVLLPHRGDIGLLIQSYFAQVSLEVQQERIDEPVREEQDDEGRKDQFQQIKPEHLAALGGCNAVNRLVNE